MPGEGGEGSEGEGEGEEEEGSERTIKCKITIKVSISCALKVHHPTGSVHARNIRILSFKRLYTIHQSDRSLIMISLSDVFARSRWMVPLIRCACMSMGVGNDIGQVVCGWLLREVSEATEND